MVLKVATEHRMFSTLEYSKKKGTKEFNNFSLKKFLKMANFFIKFCEVSVILLFNLFKF